MTEKLGVTEKKNLPLGRKHRAQNRRTSQVTTTCLILEKIHAVKHVEVLFDQRQSSSVERDLVQL